MDQEIKESKKKARVSVAMNSLLTLEQIEKLLDGKST